MRLRSHRSAGRRPSVTRPAHPPQTRRVSRLLATAAVGAADRRRTEDPPTTADTTRNARYRYATEVWVVAKDERFHMGRVGDLGIVILTLSGWFNLVVYRDSYDVYLYILCYPHL